MDGYQIGPVAEMPGVFPFNRVKYPNSEYLGFPADLGGQGYVRTQGRSGAPVYDDDQYLFYNTISMTPPQIGVIRAVLERTSQSNGEKWYLNYVVVENFGQVGSNAGGGYAVIKFTYTFDGWNAFNYLMVVNGGGTSSLTVEGLHTLSGKSWDAGVAYPGIRLGFLSNGSPDTDIAFHPELIRPEPINVYLAKKYPYVEEMDIIYFNSWNEEKGMYNWQDRDQFPEEELMEYVWW
jgi:hypothetical protein